MAAQLVRVAAECEKLSRDVAFVGVRLDLMSGALCECTRRQAEADLE